MSAILMLFCILFFVIGAVAVAIDSTWDEIIFNPVPLTCFAISALFAIAAGVWQ